MQLVRQFVRLILLDPKPVYNLLHSMFLLFCLGIFFLRHAHHKSHRVKCGPGVAFLSFQFQADCKMFFLISFRLLGCYWLTSDCSGGLRQITLCFKKSHQRDLFFWKNLSSIWYDVYDHQTYVVKGVFHVLNAPNVAIRFELCFPIVQHKPKVNVKQCQNIRPHSWNTRAIFCVNNRKIYLYTNS